jgi:hypothetical protein
MGRKLRDVEMLPDDATQILLGPDNAAEEEEIAAVAILEPGVATPDLEIGT